ncbi:MAG: sigma-70 family RNA polymerase sigma factor [Planctomycetes bacterium]|nr:sigma-70 family RNA polymerase sigma factor [Planctomycetota bacterium]
MTETRNLADAQLLQLFADRRDNNAFRELFQRHYRPVWGACRRRLGGREDLAEDAVQAVFLALFRHAGRIRNGCALSAWLYQTAGFASAQILRADMRRQDRERKAANMRETIRDPLPEAGWAEVRLRLDEAIDRLPGKQRDAVIMRYIAGKSLTEISGETGIGRETLRKRVDAGLEKLRLMLSAQHVAVSVAGLGTMIAANAMETAPAGLGQTLFAAISHNISAGGSAAGGMVNVVVKEIGKIMFMAKLKVAAGIVFATAVVAGIGSAILVAQSDKTPPVPAASAPAKANGLTVIGPMPGDAFSFVMVRNGTVVLKNSVSGWGPNWKPYIHFSTPDSTIDGDALVSSYQAKVGDKSLACKQRVSKSGQNAVTWQYDLSAEKEIDLTMFITALSVQPDIEGELELTTADGAAKTMAFKMGKGNLDKVAKAVYKFKEYGNFTFAFDPPTDLAFDNAIRVKLAGAKMPAGNHTVKMTASVESPLNLAVAPEDRAALVTTPAGADWYPLQPVTDIGPSVIGLDNWLAKPAGSRGVVKIVGDHFEFADGAPVRFWGTNLCYGAIIPAKADADYNAARFAKYGINCVRLHKFLNEGDNYGIADPNDATKFAEIPLAKFDYFTAAMGKNGVYYTFSPFFGFKVKPANKDRLVAYDEAAKLDSTYSLINYAEDVQDLMAEMYTNLLTHKNPNTGKTYAEDPALAAVEIQNEDDIFWGSMKRTYPACPTYAKLLEGRFADWLKEKYGSEDKLKAAWAGTLKPEESLEKRNIAIQYDPWFMGEEGLSKLCDTDWYKENFKTPDKDGYRRRILDNAAFLHHTQDKYYAKLVKAIRATGYKGPIIGSPWQATSMLPHYYNLKSDAAVGLVDRHNYFSGLTSSMLAQPGSGYLGTGMQQVADRPFSVSEWIHCWPAMYAAEGPAIMAVYGMGLQGWDASWQFQSGRKMSEGVTSPVSHYAMRMLSGGPGNECWNVDIPVNMGQYPALARMIYRGDVKTGEVISARQVSDENLAAGTFDFADKVVQSPGHGDEKVFTSTVPPAAMAAGRVVVEFTGEKPAKSTMPDMAKFDKNGVITSNTGQLAWDYTGKGFFTVNTPGTKAAVGFHTGKPLGCDNITITPVAQFASIFLTALEPDKTLANCKGALLTAIARQCNTGFSYMIDKSTVKVGTVPTLLEPVKVSFTITGRKIAAVNILNHEGKRIEGQTVKIDSGSFTIDTGRDKTFYYEVVFAE